MSNVLQLSTMAGSVLMRHNTIDPDQGRHAHTPVLGREVLDFLSEIVFEESGLVVDCTLGEGGHAELMLERFDDIRIIGFERDSEILERARLRLKGFGGRIEYINDNFANLSVHLAGNEMVSALLYDFGISSYHLEVSGRGFGFQRDEPLDMRLDADAGVNAFSIVNKCSEKELADIIFNYGGERRSRRIARFIAQRRREKSIDTTWELAELVLRAIPKKYRVRNIHPATRVFQALRIAVNDELPSIKKSLEQALTVLSPGGRIMAISFHSLEDRIVKNRFRRWAKGCVCGLEQEQCMCGVKPLVKVLTKKPLTPGQEELSMNRRSRSARFRVCERI